MKTNAYLQQPSLYKDTLVFITDDDLWSYCFSTQKCSRLTTSVGSSSFPKISPDGKHIAYLSSDYGSLDVYLIPLQGGMPTRLTYCGVQKICGWKDKKTLLISSAHQSFHLRHPSLYTFDIGTLQWTDLNLGPATAIGYNGRKVVLGRNNGDPARWKRYRGGTAGTLWLSANGKTFTKILTRLKTNLTNPLWIDNRIYFISDHQGIGNIFSVNANGSQIRKHTEHKDYYVRNMTTYDKKIVYQVGACIYYLDLDTKQAEEIPIDVSSTFNQALCRFESIEEYLENFSVGNKGRDISFTARGQLFFMPPWGGAPLKLGHEEFRYKRPVYLEEKKSRKIICIQLDKNNEEQLVLIDPQSTSISNLCGQRKWGKIYSLQPSPDAKFLLVTNNRNELWKITLKTRNCRLIKKNKEGPISRCHWSSDSRYFAYSYSLDRARQGIFIYDRVGKKEHSLVTPLVLDFSPIFDPSGKFLYFIGIREFEPVMSETHFDIGFPKAHKIYAVSLQAENPTLSELHLDYEDDDQKGKKKKIKTKTIEFNHIDKRIAPLFDELGGFVDLMPTKYGLLYIQKNDDDEYNLYSYNLKNKKKTLIGHDLFNWSISPNGSHILFYNSNGFRLISSFEKPSDGLGYDRNDGWIKLSRAKLYINPIKEWKQMYQEAWILQREYFWEEKISNIDWKKVYQRYLPLLERVHTRIEFSDLMWEMQGELGTSHCYEYGGNYHRLPPNNFNGLLGADLIYIPNKKAFRVEKIYCGDSWVKQGDSPLNKSGVALKKGDLIFGIDGQRFKKEKDLYVYLQNKGNHKLNLLVQKRGSTQRNNICVQTLKSNKKLLYRDWVEKNKQYVHKNSAGRLGYVHIPDMSMEGFSEFYRNFLSEYIYDGLIIDVRYNGGGFVSQLIFKMLAQKVVGFDKTRWHGIQPYPHFSVGNLVCLTNEHAGSDGDIFSHCFKLMKLGKLVGTRTWGGVIGISPRHYLADGTCTTQPEYSFWFNDVGFKVENYGTDPHIQVEVSPQDYSKKLDPQLDKAIAINLAELKKTPPLKSITD